jgi:hypothetical protein
MGDALLFAAILAPFCLLAFFAGDDLMRVLYHGHEYEGHGAVVTLLALATFASSVGTPASNALASMERPRAIFGVGAAAAVLTVVLVWWWMAQWGLAGAACGLLAGSIVGSTGLWTSFLVLVPRSGDAVPALDALEAITRNTDASRAVITRLGEGDYSTVYAVESKDGEPIWQDRRHVVIKAYKPELGLPTETAQAEFDSLSRLHEALHGRVVEGWTIATPTPLHVCASPLALVMTAVPAAKDLKSSAATDDELTPNCLEQLGRILVTAMQTIWSRGELHGDLGLQNVLYDVRSRTLSLIDPGTPECCRVCNEAVGTWRPAVLELGHILRDLGTDVRDVVGNPIARLRRQVFVESALLTFLETIGPAEDKQRALDDIRASAHTHLWKVLDPTFSLRGMCHWLLAQVVIWRMDSMLDRIVREATYASRQHQSSSAAARAHTQRA